MLYLASALAALFLLLLLLKLSQRLTLRLKVLAGVTMTRQPQKSCPHLGLSTDPFSHGNGPGDDHRCYLYMQRDRIDLLHQKSFCLSTAHHKCPWLMIRRPDAPPPLRQRLRGALGGGLRPALGLAFFGLKRIPAFGLMTAKLFWGGIGHGANGLDGIITNSARAMRRVGLDLGRALMAGFRSLGHTIAGVASDIWGLTQRSNVVVALLARGLRLLASGLWALVGLPIRLLTIMATLAGSRLAGTLASAREHRAHRAAAEPAVAMAAGAVADRESSPLDHALLAELFPGLAGNETQTLAPESVAVEPESEVQPLVWPGFEPEPTIEPVAEPVLASSVPESEPVLASSVPESGPQSEQVISQRLEAPLARFEELVVRLESLLSDGVAALDHGQDSLAYELFLKATEQPTNLADKAAPELRTQHASLMTRAWFWRAKTAETVEEVVETLEQALKYEPENLQIQAHLGWARQRLDREQHVQVGTAAALAQAKDQGPAPSTQHRTSHLLRALGAGVRILGGLMALALAALWMTTGVFPALGSYLTQLPATDELVIRRLMLTVNATALPGEGHLPLPMLHYDLGLSLPFVMAFLFVFTARGLLDGDSWARTGALALAAIAGWLCVAVVSNPEAGRLGLALCIGIIAAAVIGRFDSSKALRSGAYGY